MKKAKKIFAWLHLWVGLTVGLIFSIAAATGAILVFEDELDPLLYPSLYYAQSNNDAYQLPLSIDSLYNLALQYAKGAAINSLVIREKTNHQEAVFFQTRGDRLTRHLFSINPYTGKLQQDIKGKQHLFTFSEELHRQLLMGKTGKVITGICCLSYLVILITGLFLWWPKNSKILRQRLKIKWDAKFKRVNWDLHAVAGFYSLPILFLIAFTGLTWSYKWFNNGIFFIFDGKGPQKELIHSGENKSQQKGSLEQMYSQTQRLLPYSSDVTLYFPEDAINLVRVSKEQHHASTANVVDQLFFDRNTGELVKKELYATRSKGMKVRRLIFPIHTGSLYGLPTKLLAFLSCLIGSSLPITGFIIWLKRKNKKKNSKIKKQVHNHYEIVN